MPSHKMNRPALDASESEILDYAKSWIRLAARKGFEAAVSELEPSRSVHWTQSLLEQVTFDHFGDGCQPRITDPDKVQDLHVEAYEYNDGTGYAVDHDLPLDGKRSDFTVQFDFRKGVTEYLVYLDDIHVL
ncbi:DUF7668 domain-containing protein [Aeoliella straminimaris]|uniref:DUF7668 domain-containing protein n=1 Tax=Aeoliella straminimaris TaxID=2954799 RepID=UPI003CC5910D